MALFDFKRKEVTPETDNRKKRAFVRYFEILTSKFSKLVLVNLVYFACLIPLISGALLITCTLFGVSAEVVESFFFMHLLVWLASTIASSALPIAIILFLASFIAYGPLTAGLTFCVRNIVTGRQFWISDLFSRAKSNLKQGITLGLLDSLIFASLVLYLSADFSVVQGGRVVLYNTLRIAAVMISIIYIVARFYTYTIAVTFELRIRDIFKNARIFCVLGFFKNILALLICFVMVCTCVSTPKIDIVLIATIFFSVCRYSVLFTTYPTIEKYMMKSEVTDEEQREA